MSAFVRQKILNPPAIKEPPQTLRVFFLLFHNWRCREGSWQQCQNLAVLPQCLMQGSGGVVSYLIIDMET